LNEVVSALDKQGMTVVASSPEEFRAYVSRSMQRGKGRPGRADSEERLTRAAAGRRALFFWC